MRNSRFRKGSLRRTGGLVNASLDRLGLRHRVLECQAVAKWPQVVGPHIAASTVAERVRDGVLFVCCKSSAWSNELSFHKANIVQRLNKALGKKVIVDIRLSAKGFRQASKQARKEETGTRAKGLESIKLDQVEIDAAARVWENVPSKELAEQIRRAVLTSKRLEVVKRREGWRECPRCSALYSGPGDTCGNCG